MDDVSTMPADDAGSTAPMADVVTTGPTATDGVTSSAAMDTTESQAQQAGNAGSIIPSSDPSAGDPNIVQYGSVKVDRSGLFKLGKNPMDGCEIIGEEPPEDEDEICTYQVLGKDIPLDPNTEELVLSTARIGKLVNLDIIGPRLKRLKLIANLIDKIEGLETLCNLQHLELYQNRIKKIENLEALVNLEHLDLSFNGIRKLGYLDGNAVFADKLKALYLPNNKIDEIPDNTVNAFKKLEVLELGANRIRTIGSTLDGLTNLRELWLGKNKITSMAMTQLLPNLEICSVQCNRLETWDESFFRNCPKLRLVYFSENRLADFEFEKTFAHLPHLEELDLSQNIVTQIPASFHVPKLRELWMSSNKVDFDNEQSPSIAGLRNLTNLQCLYLEHNPCWDANYKDGGETYKRVLKAVCGPSLQQLDAIHLEFQRQLEEDKYRALYAARDDTVTGIRKVDPNPESSDLQLQMRGGTPMSTADDSTSGAPGGEGGYRLGRGTSPAGE